MRQPQGNERIKSVFVYYRATPWSARPTFGEAHRLRLLINDLVLYRPRRPGPAYHRVHVVQIEGFEELRESMMLGRGRRAHYLRNNLKGTCAEAIANALGHNARRIFGLDKRLRIDRKTKLWQTIQAGEIGPKEED